MRRLGTLFLVALCASAVWGACGGDEEEGGTKGPGEPCDIDDDCANGTCVVAGDGSKACAQSDDDGGGW